MLRIIGLSLFLLIAGGCQQGVVPAGPTPDGKNTFYTGLMYWATDIHLIESDCYLVVAGTVIQTQPTRLPANGEPSVRGLIRVERALMVSPKARVRWGSGFEYISTDGCDGLKPGDHLVVFVDEYDPDGILPKAGTNTRVGIRIESWDHPVIKAVQALHNDPGAKAAMLRQPQYRSLWEQIDSAGLKAYDEHVTERLRDVSP